MHDAPHFFTTFAQLESSFEGVDPVFSLYASLQLLIEIWEFATGFTHIA